MDKLRHLWDFIDSHWFEISAVAEFRGALAPGSSKLGHRPKGRELGDHHVHRLAFHSNGASTTLLPNRFSPTSVQLKSEINGAFLCKRHQKQHLEFCTTPSVPTSLRQF